MPREKFSSTYERLAANGFEAEQDLRVRSAISIKEKGVKYLFLTSGKEASVVYAIDGHIIKDGRRCDKLLLVEHSKNPEQWTEVFVELKGGDINHAISQLEQTLEKEIFKHPSNTDIRARIVTHSIPTSRSNTKLERAKIYFLKKYKCNLRTIKSKSEEKLERYGTR